MSKLADKLRALARNPTPTPLTKQEIRTTRLAASELETLYIRCATQRDEIRDLRTKVYRQHLDLIDAYSKAGENLGAAPLYLNLLQQAQSHVNGAMGCADPVDIMETPRAVAQIVKALVFYAEPAGYGAPDSPLEPAVKADGGHRAREALGIPEPKPRIRVQARTEP